MALRLVNTLINKFQIKINLSSIDDESESKYEHDQDGLSYSHYNRPLIFSETVINGYINNVQTVLHKNLIIPTTINYLIYTFHSPWFVLQTMPQTLKHVYPSPVFYHNSIINKEYIIVCPLHEDTRNIYIYSCSDDAWSILTEYPSQFDPICHTNIIDPYKHDLIIFGGFNKVFGKFNLLTHEWTITTDSNKRNVAESSHGSAVWIPEPYNKLHAMVPHRDDQRRVYHLKYEPVKNQFVRASKNGINGNGKLFRAQMVAVTANKRAYIMMLGGYRNNSRGDEIWYCDVTKGEETHDCVWKLFPKRLPLKNYAKAVVAFERILVLMIGDINDNDEAEGNYQLVYCLEIDDFKDNNYNEWIRCDIKPQLTFKMGINNSSDYIYFMNHYDPQEFNKIHISNVIPYAVYRKYRE